MRIICYTETMEHSLCVFGDSTAWGAWDNEKGGWVNRLWLYFAEHDDPYVEVCNLSISGGTSEDVLKRFESEAKAREATALVFQTGANDAAYRNTEGNFQVMPEAFEKNIESIITKARALTGRIMWLGSKGVDESRTTPIPWRPDLFYTNANTERYNGIIQSVCETQNVPYCDLAGIVNKDELDDGIHPTAQGHQKLFQKILPEIQNLIR